LLCPDLGRRPRLFWTLHIIVFFAIAGSCLLLRRVFGDERAALVLGGTGEFAFKVAAACAIGFFVTFRAALVDSWTNALHFLHWQYILLSCLGGAMVFGVLVSAMSEIPSGIVKRAGGLILAGLVGVAFAHVLCFRAEYFPPIAVLGRLSALHLGAAIPWSMFVAGLFFLALKMFSRLRFGLAAAAAAVFTIWIMYGIVFQDQGMAKSWSQQKQVWTRFINISGKLRDNDLLVIDMKDAPSALGFSMAGFLNSRSQAGLAAFVRFPKAWKTPPRIVGYSPDLASQRGPGQVALKTIAWAPPDQSAILTNGSFYFFRWVGNELVPVETPIELAGVMLTPRRIDLTPLRTFPPTRVCKVIFGD
jgi:hypothetical protein